jgi:(1->4)-alpha-D-glucan 1-alpha-D-glucosylmutase
VFAVAAECTHLSDNMNLRASPAVLMAESSGIAECLDRLAARKKQQRALSTYRIQFNAGFRFREALEIVPYLHALGITHCYSSPILKARTGSTHGYDITNHNEINPELGTEEELREFAARLNEHGMGLILDTVPNHMGIGQGDNPWWQDVLENGRASEYSEFFDIDWEPVKPELWNKVLIPILADQYGTELESGKLRLAFEEARFVLWYYDKPLPIDPQTAPIIFEALGDLRAHHASAAIPEEDRSQLENILWELRRLPPHTTTSPELALRRREQIEQLRRRLSGLLATSPQIGSLIEAAVRLCNGQPGNHASFDVLHRLLEAQCYRIADWRVSAQEINYRRFFDINDLVGLRMEIPRVFAATHKLIRRLLAEGVVNGLRIDHPDGLLNPMQYFIRAQMLYAASQCCGPEPTMATADNGIETELQDLLGHHDWMHLQSPLYLLVEKILERGEDLPLNWPVDGTVGYDFTNLLNGVFIDTRNERVFTNIYRRFVGGPLDVDTMIYGAKNLIMKTSLSSEVTVLSHLLEQIANADRHARDFTRTALTDAIVETIACFPVYRTYTDERGNISDRDRAYVDAAIANAKRRNLGRTASLFDFLRSILLLSTAAPTDDEYRRRVDFTLKFQQLTGPVMAKGLEDTVCYVYNRFVSVNEVGGTPKEFGITLDEFHRGNLKRAEQWPSSMLATSTHDTKRSEDVRARLNVISEIPRLWSSSVMRWRRLNRPKKQALADGRAVPDFNEEYLLYQTLAGAWPVQMKTDQARREFSQRIKQYMAKALHEGKVNLSWVNQNPEYIEAMERFIERILRPGTGSRANQFLEHFERFVAPLAYFGLINSLSQTVVKLTAPGVPDIYQGSELWNFSLVDPDNRRPVDYEIRRRELEYLSARSQENELPSICDEMIATLEDGRAKLWTTMRSLNFRREHAALFQSGAYVPLYASLEKAGHVIAFARELDGESAVTAAPRFAYTLMKGELRPPLGDVWGDTEIAVTRASADYENVLTGEKLKSSHTRALLCREVFARFPVAMLVAR